MASPRLVCRFEFEHARVWIKRSVFYRETFEVPVHASTLHAGTNHARQFLPIPMKFEGDGVPVVEGGTEVADPCSAWITSLLRVVGARSYQEQRNRQRGQDKMLHDSFSRCNLSYVPINSMVPCFRADEPRIRLRTQANVPFTLSVPAADRNCEPGPFFFEAPAVDATLRIHDHPRRTSAVDHFVLCGS